MSTRAQRARLAIESSKYWVEKRLRKRLPLTDSERRQLRRHLEWLNALLSELL